MARFKIIAVVFVAVLTGVAYDYFNAPVGIPTLQETWWGPGLPTKEGRSIKPFKINISDEVIEDLKYRLQHARKVNPSLEGIQQQYGINSELLMEVVDFWKTKYDWRKREEFLNQFPQYVTSIQGLKIHFLHLKPIKEPGIRVLPLLLLHGWGGSIREFYEILPILTTPQEGKDVVFEIIAPSLPGFGFSDGASKPGLSFSRMGLILKNLMKRLGHDQFYIQGGDWGSAIGGSMARFFPKNVLGFHSNMCMVASFSALLKMILGSLYPTAIVDESYKYKLYPLTKTFSNLIEETGYMHIQATKPDTIGVALSDSPIGLAAYLLEKFTIWTNPKWKQRKDGGLLEKFTYTQLLDNIMIYWVTNSVTTSMRLYAESMNTQFKKLQSDRIPIDVPTACTRFENDLFYFPDVILKENYRNLIYSSDYRNGGHFAAFEVPKVLAEDIYVAITKMEQIRRKNKE